MPASISWHDQRTFTPTMTGTRHGSVTVTDDANGSPHTVALTVTGTYFTLGVAGAMLFVFAIAGSGANGHKSTPTNITLTGDSDGVGHTATVALTVK